MKTSLIIKNILYNLNTIKSKNILLRANHTPYSIDLAIFLNNFDLLSDNLIQDIILTYFSKNKTTIIDFNNNFYLFKLSEDNSIFIKELCISNKTLFEEKNISNFIYGNKNIKILYKSKELSKRHELIYSLINSIRAISNDIIVVLEHEKFYNTRNTNNIFNFYKEAINFEDYLRYLKNIDFRYLLIPDLNNTDFINKIILNFYNKKIFISTNIDFNFNNKDVLLLEEQNNASFKINVFNESNLYKTLNRL